MEGISVVVESTDNSGCSVSCSGIRMNSNYVVSHCCIVWTLVETYLASEKIELNFSNVMQLQKSISSFIKRSNMKYKVITEAHTFEANTVSNGGMNGTSIEVLDATLDNIIIPPKLLNSLFQLLSKDDWNFLIVEEEKKSEENSNSKLNQWMKKAVKNSLYLSTFLILQIGDGNFTECLQSFEAITSLPKKGDYIFLQGSPFGSNAPALLLNSLSQGIIGNIVPDGNLFVTDARCTLGCEGGPAYSCGKSLLVCGIILSPNCSLLGNWVGLTFVASMRPLLDYMKTFVIPEKNLKIKTVPSACSSHLTDKGLLKSNFKLLANSFITSSVVKLMELSIVRISVSDNKGVCWGSGVVVNAHEGLIISCAHVVRDAHDKKVEVCFSNGTLRYGTVIYQSNIQYEKENHQYRLNFINAWDIAVIQMSGPCDHALPLAKELPLVGATVFNGGHSLFWRDSIVSPTFSIGNIAKILELPSEHFRHTTSVENPFESELKMCSIFGNKNGIETNTLSNSPANLKEMVVAKNFDEIKSSTKFICHDWKEYDDHSKSFAAMLQTTCAVYSGLSGGPVVAIHPDKGPLVIGIVTSCVQSQNVNIIFPHVNMAVPSFFISKAIDSYSLSKDPADFGILNINSPEAVNLCTFKQNLYSRL